MEQVNNGKELTTDRYTESIEISNKCREFYLKRMEDAESRKQSTQTNPSPRGRRITSIDTAMSKLREEMNSLMDQDLSLMKQLLVLNETIEELKWKRRCSYDSMPDSSAELDVSDWSLSDNDLFESCDDVCKKSQHGETEVPEVTSLANAIKHKCTTHESHIPTKKIEKKSEKIYKFKIENAIYKQTSEEDQSSWDSGICDSFLEECS